MATEAEIKAVFDILKNDRDLAEAAVRAINWASARAEVKLSKADTNRIAIALTDPLIAGRPPTVSNGTNIVCVQKGCTVPPSVSPPTIKKVKLKKLNG